MARPHALYDHKSSLDAAKQTPVRSHMTTSRFRRRPARPGFMAWVMLVAGLQKSGYAHAWGMQATAFHSLCAFALLLRSCGHHSLPVSIRHGVKPCAQHTC